MAYNYYGISAALSGLAFIIDIEPIRAKGASTIQYCFRPYGLIREKASYATKPNNMSM